MTKHKADKTPQMGFWERNRKSGGYLLQKKTKEIAVRIIRAILLFGMCFLQYQKPFGLFIWYSVSYTFNFLFFIMYFFSYSSPAYYSANNSLFNFSVKSAPHFILV